MNPTHADTLEAEKREARAGAVKPTFAQMKILRRLHSQQDAMLITETRERGYAQCPTFHARWYGNSCATCGHRDKGDPASWRAVFALQEAGLIKELIPGGGVFISSSITAAGHAVLVREAGEDVR